MDTKRIDNWEIFAAGTWSGSGGASTWTEADLDAMVSAFEATGKQMKPYLKLGHSGKQGLLQEDGMPAAGWITALKRVGAKLVATVEGIPAKIYELIQSRAYGRVSSEIYKNAELDGKKYPRLLKAVALLGADTPAVTTLQDFIDLYAMPEAAEMFGNECEVEIIFSKEEDKMEDKTQVTLEEFTAVSVELSAIKEERDGLKAELEKFTAQEKNLIALQTELAEFKAQKEADDKAIFEKEVEFCIDGFVKDGHINPGEADFYKTMAKKSQEDFELYKHHLEGKKADYVGEDSEATEPTTGDVGEEEDEKMFAMANKIVADGERAGKIVDYRTALIEAGRSLKGGK